MVDGYEKPICENGLAAMSAEDRDREFVLLAHLIRTQGRHGELIADILTDFPERFAERKHVWLLPPDAKGAPREAEIERHWLHKGRVVLKFVGIDSISDATPFARMAGCDSARAAGSTR